MEKWVRSNIVYDGKVVRLRVGEVRLDDGTLAHREVIEHAGGVCVVPFTGERVILVRQFRIAMGEYILEAPAGKIEPDDTHPEARGALEVEEETGYRPGRMVPVGVRYATVGFCSERIHLYLALDLERVAQRPDPEERIEVVELPLREVRERLVRHEFADAKTALGLYALLEYLDAPATREPAAP